jgi:hypothetical protein
MCCAFVDRNVLFLSGKLDAAIAIFLRCYNAFRDMQVSATAASLPLRELPLSSLLSLSSLCYHTPCAWIPLCSSIFLPHPFCIPRSLGYHVTR